MSLSQHVLSLLVNGFVLLVIRVGLILLGLPLVALGLPFRVQGQSVKYDRTIVNMPRWLWLWGNDADGLQGDIRGWWNENADGAVFFGLVRHLRERFFPKLPILTAEHPLAMWWWAAVRNPANNLRYVAWANCVPKNYTIQLLAGQAAVADKPGQGGWQFVVARPISGANAGLSINCYGFYFVHEWSATRAFVIRLGHKVEPRHAGTDEPKGLVFKINPYKKI